jgi:hypothetical protein
MVYTGKRCKFGGKVEKSWVIIFNVQKRAFHAKYVF